MTGAGVGAVNICKSLAAGPSPMPSRLGWVYWMAYRPEGLAFWRLGASFPPIAFSRGLQLPSREAQQPRKAMHEDRVGGASVEQPSPLSEAPSGLAPGCWWEGRWVGGGRRAAMAGGRGPRVVGLTPMETSSLLSQLWSVPRVVLAAG